MLIISLLAVTALVVSVVAFDQYLLARSQRFTQQHRSEMSRFRALLG